jgi:hypothetical protein
MNNLIEMTDTGVDTLFINAGKDKAMGAIERLSYHRMKHFLAWARGMK